MPSLTVGELLDRKSGPLRLRLLTDPETRSSEITTSEVASPGLVLAGFDQRFTHTRSQILGETEIVYLRSLPEAERKAAIERLFAHDLPVVIVTKALEVPDVVLETANRRGIPVLSTDLKTGEFYATIKSFLEAHFAPSTFIHGSLADVYGVGLLFVGRSGIGKSECVLDLVERGHRLVADGASRFRIRD